jgi:hypothetical protein
VRRIFTKSFKKSKSLLKSQQPAQNQGCHKGRNWRKITSERPFRPDVRARPRLPRGRVFTVRGRSKNRVRADAGLRPRGRSSASARTLG